VKMIDPKWTKSVYRRVKRSTLVVCFNCRKLIPKKEAFYINIWDVYYCPKCYIDLLEGKPVRKTNWRRRGI
jgi:hypothetical protein